MQCGLLWGNLPHHLDHLAPFCSLQNIPLVITDEELCSKAKNLYKDVELIHWDFIEAPVHIIHSFDEVISTLPKRSLQDIFGLQEKLYRKRIKTSWLPHGHSDKNHCSPFFGALQEETSLLFYGPKMGEEFQKEVPTSTSTITFTGNFRLAYSQRQKEFYDSLLETIKIPREKHVILYAPSWEDSLLSSSLEEALPHLVSNIPEPYHLIIKPHPNTATKTPPILHPQVTWLTDFYPIYPLLSLVDLYIGDLSSIGYDFLYFDKPLFFLLSEKELFSKQLPPLLLCGRVIPAKEFKNLYETVQKWTHHDLESFQAIRKRTYLKVFSTETPLLTQTTK